MVYFHSSISVCKSVYQPSGMASSMNLADPCSKSRQRNQLQRIKKTLTSHNSPKNPACHRSRSVMVDIVLLVAVIFACGYLVFPYIKFVIAESVQISQALVSVMKEEFADAPLVYGSVGLGLLCATLGAWAVMTCTSRRCGNPKCKGLRKAAEFDIQLEPEDCAKNSPSLGKDGVNMGLLELPRDHHRELEAELKKMAPPNGRAVLIYRARCGCSIVRLEVSGPKKQRKFKKWHG